MDAATFRARPHPVVLAAAIAVMILSLLGIAALGGFIPTANSKKSESPIAAKSVRETPRAVPSAPSPTCGNCGVVESIRAVEVKGDAAGHHLGNGRGNAVATVVGASGGDTGHESEKNVKPRVAYRVTVHLDDGSYRTLSQSAPPALVVGSKVQIVDGAVVPRSAGE